MSVVLAGGLKLVGKTIFSGIQPTGVFHVGNLLGALQSWVDLSQRAPSDAKVIFMVADLHAITVAKPPELLREMRWAALASILASGIDVKKCTVYFQSQVPAHTELYWLLSPVTSMGYLSRMVQWKSKSNLANSASINNLGAGQLSDLNLGLFAYPTLQAADVLIHQADYVPVGDDQAQHLELTRHVAQAFNHRYGPVFKLPSTVFTPHKKILSLKDASKKMSKSDADTTACILLTDETDVIRDKIRRATTDSVQGPITFDTEARPEVSNLLLIASGILGMSPLELLDQNKLADHKELKDLVTDVLVEKITPIREEYNRLLGDKHHLEEVARQGALSVREGTRKTLENARAAMGF